MPLNENRFERSKGQYYFSCSGFNKRPECDRVFRCVKLRSIATITAQCVNGKDFGLQHQIRVGLRQLRRHIGYALDAGLTRREICEVFAQAGWYRGWPHAEDALEEAREVFAARGI